MRAFSKEKYSQIAAFGIFVDLTKGIKSHGEVYLQKCENQLTHVLGIQIPWLSCTQSLRDIS